MMQLSATELVLAATGLKPEGSDVCDERHTGMSCAVCGVSLRAGDPVDDLVLPPSFTNHNALAHPGNPWRCGACTAVMTRSIFQMGASSVLICRDGIFPIMKKEHRAWALQTPPDTPFALCVQNAKQQHVVWRTPVTLSKEQILIRVGEQVVRLRRSLLLKAADEARYLAQLKSEKGRPVKDAIESPFVADWKFQSSDGGRLKRFVYKLLEQEQITTDNISSLLQLNAGEAWALGAFLHEKPIAPESITPSIL